jgi:hypothetical protein
MTRGLRRTANVFDATGNHSGARVRVSVDAALHDVARLRN